MKIPAQVVELADTLVLEASASRRESSSLSLGTIFYIFVDTLLAYQLHRIFKNDVCAIRTWRTILTINVYEEKNSSCSTTD